MLFALEWIVTIQTYERSTLYENTPTKTTEYMHKFRKKFQFLLLSFLVPVLSSALFQRIKTRWAAIYLSRQSLLLRPYIWKSEESRLVRLSLLYPVTSQRVRNRASECVSQVCKAHSAFESDRCGKIVAEYDVIWNETLPHSERGFLNRQTQKYVWYLRYFNWITQKKYQTVTRLLLFIKRLY